MSEKRSQSQGSLDENSADKHITPGELLSRQRERAGLSHATVGEALHLTVHYIKAIENNEYNKLPGLTFVKGYIRAYARYLHMDTVAVLSCYEAHLASIGIDKDNIYGAVSRHRSDQTLLWAVAAAIILVIALVSGWWFFGRGAATTTAAAGSVPFAPHPVIAVSVDVVSNNKGTTALSVAGSGLLR